MHGMVTRIVTLVLVWLCGSSALRAELGYGVARGLAPKPSYAPYPAWEKGYVTDLAHVLKPAEEERLENELWEAEEGTELEIAILTIRSIRDYPETLAKTNDEFAAHAVAAYNVGNPAYNNGILLVIFQEDREACIALGKTYDHRRDVDTARILKKKVLPPLKQGKFSKAIFAGVKGIEDEFLGPWFKKAKPWNWTVILAVLGVVATVFVVMVIYSLCTEGTKGWGWEMVELSGWAALAVFNSIALVFLGLTTNNMNEHRDYFGSSDSKSSTYRGIWGGRDK